MSDGTGTILDACGGAGATAVSGTRNRPGLSALSYRVGRYATFLRDMISQIHSAAIPDGPNLGRRPLAALTTRDSDDPAIALLDAWAIVADVLTFYQERIANEGYLRTATERRSLLELARTIGYELGPGVAASTYLTFTADEAPGAPRSVVVGPVTKVQNLPSQGKLPQTFETVETIQAYSGRNALRPRLTRRQDLALVDDPTEKDGLKLYMLGIDSGFPPGPPSMILKADQVYPLSAQTVPESVVAVPVGNQVYLDGTSTRLKTGDRLLLVGRNNGNPPVVKTKVVIIRDIEVQPVLNRTRVDVRDDLGQTPDPPRFVAPKPQPAMLFTGPLVLNIANLSTIFSGAIRESDLQAQMFTNKWVPSQVLALAPGVILEPTPPPPPPHKAGNLPIADPGVFALRTRVGFFGNTAPNYTSLRAPTGQGFPQTEAGPKNFLFEHDWDTLGWEIWRDSVSGTFYSNANVFLEQVVPGIVGDSWVVLETRGNKPLACRASEVVEGALAGFGLSGRVTGLTLMSPDGTAIEFSNADKTTKKDFQSFKVRDTTAYAQSEALTLARLPIPDDIPAGSTEFMLDNLVLGLNAGQPVALTGSRTANDAPGLVSNEVLILSDIVHVRGFTTLQFTTGLAFGYTRSTVTINANVSRATHGETVNEVLGSGDASRANQTFTLKRLPLTYIPAASVTGSKSTLEVRVNDILWSESPSLYELGPQDRNYIVRLEDDGTTTITFGDGVNGARLPSGSQNVAATYRSGIGSDGNVEAGSLTLLQTRPPGIRAVTNPANATGAASREDLDRARSNAPLKVLTLDRIVSIEDYENFARAFAGIGKAAAVALWSGEKHLVHLTVAGANGEAVDDISALYTSLTAAIAQAGLPLQQVLVESFQPLFFDIEASVLVNQPRYVAAEVLSAVAAALREAFSFDRRSFAQPATAAEVVTAIQSVPGVIAANLSRLFPVTVGKGAEQFNGLAPVLCSSPAGVSDGQILPAQLLLVNPAGINLTEMQA